MFLKSSSTPGEQDNIVKSMTQFDQILSISALAGSVHGWHMPQLTIKDKWSMQANSWGTQQLLELGKVVWKDDQG